MRKELIKPAARSTDPAMGGQQAGQRLGCGPPPCYRSHVSPLAKAWPPVATQNLFVLVALPNIWTNSKVKNIKNKKHFISYAFS